LDDALFDRILPPRGVTAPDTPQTPPPDQRQASAIAGAYEASDEPLSSIAALKIQGRRLNVAATNDGGIVLSGSESAVLAPRPGGYWGAPNGNLNAVESNGRLVLSSGIFRPLRPWKRPELYASVALLFAIGMGGALYHERRRKRALNFPSALVLALSVVAIGFLLPGPCPNRNTDVVNNLVFVLTWPVGLYSEVYHGQLSAQEWLQRHACEGGGKLGEKKPSPG